MQGKNMEPREKYIAAAIENITITFNRIIDKANPSQMIQISCYYQESIKELTNLLNKYAR